MSVRKDKAARLKLNVLDSTLKLIGKKSFDDVYVDDICLKVKITKVTLFSYFPTKEDILLYYLRIWCLKRAVEFRDKPKEGLQGILYIFDKLSEECKSHPGIILRLFAYLADFRRPPRPFTVKVEEKKFLLPGITNIQTVEILSIEQMFENFLLEAISKKEVTKTGSTRDMTNLFTAILYGSVATAHINQVSNLKFFFRKNIELALKGFQ